MSLKTALDLLQIAEDMFAIKSGKGTHTLMLMGGKLVLSINDGSKFRDFCLDESDFEKTPLDIVAEIDSLIENHVEIKNDSEKLHTK